MNDIICMVNKYFVYYSYSFRCMGSSYVKVNHLIRLSKKFTQNMHRFSVLHIGI